MWGEERAREVALLLYKGGKREMLLGGVGTGEVAEEEGRSPNAPWKVRVYMCRKGQCRPASTGCVDSGASHAQT